jgi:hypothetical protein
MGCSNYRPETGFHNFSKVQVQFTAPAGAMVTLGNRTCGKITPDRSHQINIYPKASSRLERNPEETATFNLCPGKYEFKYSGLEQCWEGVSVYGDLEIHQVNLFCLPGAEDLIRRVFIPVTLTAPMTRLSSLDIVATCPNRVGINPCDMQRLMAGDMITKVVFIADLKKIDKAVDKLEVEHVVLQAERQRLMACLNEAKLDWLEAPCSKGFIKLERDLKINEQAITANRERAGRYEALLRANNVLIRREMLVMATNEILPPNEDPVRAAEEVGEVVLVMHIGSRHLHWGCIPGEQTAAIN